MSTVMIVTPHCPTLTTFFISATVMGICAGCYDAAQIVWMMEMMQKECPPFVLAQHFFWAVGTFLSSLIMAPFLQQDQDNEDMDDENAVKVDEIDYGSKLFIPYTIVGGLLAVSAAAQILLFIFMRYRPPPPKIIDDTDNVELKVSLKDQDVISSDANVLRVGKWSFPKIRMVALVAVFLGALVGMELCTFEFFSKFGQNSNLNLSEQRAAYTLTGMTGRGIGIIVAIKIRPQLILCVNITLVIVANIILIGWASDSLAALWFSSITFGVGFSTMFPAFCAYVERYLKFTDFIGGLMIVCASAMAGLYPLIIGRYIEENPVVLSYTAFFSIALILGSFGTLSYLTHKHKTRY